MPLLKIGYGYTQHAEMTLLEDNEEARKLEDRFM